MKVPNIKDVHIKGVHKTGVTAEIRTSEHFAAYDFYLYDGKRNCVFRSWGTTLQNCKEEIRYQLYRIFRIEKGNFKWSEMK